MAGISERKGREIPITIDYSHHLFKIHPKRDTSEVTSGGKPKEIPEGIIVDPIKAARRRVLPTKEEKLDDLDPDLLPELKADSNRQEINMSEGEDVSSKQ